MNSSLLLLLNLALAFYLVGAIWAHEVDIFRSWRFVDAKDFARLQGAHFRKLPYWIFAPLALALAGSVILIVDHPAGSPRWAIWGNLAFQLTSHVLTACMWGPWQAKLSRDPQGPRSEYLAKILRTHWLRTALISLYGVTLLVWAMRVFA